MWSAQEAAGSSHPFIHAIPGSGGMMLFGWQWQAFTSFLHSRTRAPLYASEGNGGAAQGGNYGIIDGGLHHLTPPGCTHCSGAHGRGRLLTEFVYGRGLAFLHPNLASGASFSRAFGSSAALVRTVDADMAPQHPIGLAPVFDLGFRKQSALTVLQVQGMRFLDALEAAHGHQPVYKELLSCWRRPREPEPPYGELRYLVYQPQFGMGNQIRALKAALAVARVLGRTLVIPDFITENGLGVPVPFETVFAFDRLEAVAGRQQVLLHGLFQDLIHGRIVPAPHQVFRVAVPVVQLNPSNAYFDKLGWGGLPQVEVELRDRMDRDWVQVFDSCGDDVLAVSGMFGMFGGWTEGALDADKAWHLQVGHHVAEEAQWVLQLAQRAVDHFWNRLGKDRARDGGFICGHVRRGDFHESCELYLAEAANENGRAWVKGMVRGGWQCWVNETLFEDHVRTLVANLPDAHGVDPQFVYVSTDDEDFVAAIRARSPIPVWTLKDAFSSHDFGNMHLPPHRPSAAMVRAAEPLIDVSICTEARVQVLNRFSTFSALIKEKSQQHPSSTEVYHWRHPPPLSRVVQVEENESSTR